MNNAITTEENFKKIVGRNINKIRLEKGITNEDLAWDIGLETVRVLYCYYNGTKAPSLQRLKMIANVLNVTVDSLLQ